LCRGKSVLSIRSESRTSAEKAPFGSFDIKTTFADRVIPSFLVSDDGMQDTNSNA